MFADIWNWIIWLIGVDLELAQLTTMQTVTRTIIVYGVALLLIRLGKRRFLGGYTAFDILMGFVVGSILSRAITGRENLFSVSVVIATLMVVHYIISYITFLSSNASRVLKNEDRQLVEDGVVNEEAMRISKLGEKDLLQALRKKGGVESPEDVKSAYLERDGSITVIPRESKPKIIEIKVKDGVQTVKVELSANS